MDKKLITKEENQSGITDLELFKQVLTASCYVQSSWQLYDTFDWEGQENVGRSWEHWLKVRIARFYGNMALEL